MKATVSTESPTPLLEREELDHARLELTGLPKDEPLGLSVSYEDRFEPTLYELGATPDGRITFTFPILGAGGSARLGRKTEDGFVQLGDAIALEGPEPAE